MSSLILYKKPIAIDRNTHRELKIKFQPKGFDYAATTNSVPVTTGEFGIACLEYPIVFVTDEEDGGLPIALTGLRDNENLFVGQDGSWDASFVPVFVRRYPFVLQEGTTPGSFSVLVDAEADGFDAADGQRLFNEDGSNAPMLDSVLEMLNHFSASTEHTMGFVKQLRKLDLLTPRAINATTAQGKSLQMNGFSVVDEAKLSALSDADLLSLTRNGYLGSIYGHLISLNNIQKLLARLERISAA
ncbi:hypothetical protein AAKU67_000518 [Oxalobacteraceae bacterium GrIS 2.11]